MAPVSTELALSSCLSVASELASWVFVEAIWRRALAASGSTFSALADGIGAEAPAPGLPGTTIAGAWRRRGRTAEARDPDHREAADEEPEDRAGRQEEERARCGNAHEDAHAAARAAHEPVGDRPAAARARDIAALRAVADQRRAATPGRRSTPFSKTWHRGHSASLPAGRSRRRSIDRPAAREDSGRRRQAPVRSTEGNCATMIQPATTVSA